VNLPARRFLFQRISLSVIKNLVFQSLVVVVLLGKIMRKIFFGQLRAAEFEHLMERSVLKVLHILTGT
jgi:hypothetical protein